jgi:hypothetical protein
MSITRIVCSGAFVIGAMACAHHQKEPSNDVDSRIKPSSANPARDTAAEYGNQRTRMGAPSDSSRRETSGATGTAGQNDPNLIGSPAWWRTHLTADGKPRP